MKTYRSAYLRGFTLIELLVVIAIIAILAGMLLPVLAKTKAKGQSAICANNLKQLQLSWQLYTDENQERIPLHWTEYVTGAWRATRRSWVLGSAPEDRSTTNLQDGTLFPYHQSVAIHHCPTDRSTVVRMKSMLRTRSYALDWCLGWVSQDTGLAIKSRLSQVANPSQIFAFIDEHEDTVDDATLWQPDYSWRLWGNVPSDRHARGCNLSFVDGHVEYWKWAVGKKAATTNPVPELKDLLDYKRLFRACPLP